MITKDEIQKLADLARISITEEEKESLQKDIGGILAYVDQIKEASAERGELWEPSERNVMREDTPTRERGEYKNSLVFAAPKNENGYVKVKKIL